MQPGKLVVRENAQLLVLASARSICKRISLREPRTPRFFLLRRRQCCAKKPAKRAL